MQRRVLFVFPNTFQVQTKRKTFQKQKLFKKKTDLGSGHWRDRNFWSLNIKKHISAVGTGEIVIVLFRIVFLQQILRETLIGELFVFLLQICCYFHENSSSVRTATLCTFSVFFHCKPFRQGVASLMLQLFVLIWLLQH